MRNLGPKSIGNISFNAYRPIFLLFWVLPILMAGYFISHIFPQGQMISWTNKLLPIVMLLALLCTWIRTCQKIQSADLVSTTLVFCICAVYFGFGPLIYYFGSTGSLLYIDNFYPISEIDLLRTNMLNAIAIFFVLLGFLIGSKIFPLAQHFPSNSVSMKNVRHIILIFVILGGAIKYLYILPYQFGFINFIIPGSIMQFQYLTSLAIIPTIFLIHNGYKKWRILLFPLIGIGSPCLNIGIFKDISPHHYSNYIFGMFFRAILKKAFSLLPSPPSCCPTI